MINENLSSIEHERFKGWKTLRVAVNSSLGFNPNTSQKFSPFNENYKEYIYRFLSLTASRVNLDIVNSPPKQNSDDLDPFLTSSRVKLLLAVSCILLLTTSLTSSRINWPKLHWIVTCNLIYPCIPSILTASRAILDIVRHCSQQHFGDLVVFFTFRSKNIQNASWWGEKWTVFRGSFKPEFEFIWSNIALNRSFCHFRYFWSEFWKRNILDVFGA